MTTRESFKPRLLTRERVPEFVALAGTMTLGSTARAGGGAGAAAGADAVVVGPVAGFVSLVFLFAVVLFADLTGGGVVTGSAGVAEAVDAGAALLEFGAGAEAAGAATFIASFPRTSMISRSGSRSVKLVTRPIVPKSRTTRTVDMSYWPTRICWSS